MQAATAAEPWPGHGSAARRAATRDGSAERDPGLPARMVAERGKRISDTSCGPGPTGTHPRHLPQLHGLTGDDLPWLEDAIVANLLQAAAPRPPVVALAAPTDGYRTLAE
jgi:hypothetical protein